LVSETEAPFQVKYLRPQGQREPIVVPLSRELVLTAPVLRGNQQTQEEALATREISEKQVVQFSEYAREPRGGSRCGNPDAMRTSGGS